MNRGTSALVASMRRRTPLDQGARVLARSGPVRAEQAINAAGNLTGPAVLAAVVGWGEVFATPGERQASEALDVMFTNSQRLEIDADRAVKEGKIAGYDKNRPLPQDALWMRISRCASDARTYYQSVKGPDGSGITWLTEKNVRTNTEQLEARIAALREELEKAAPGLARPVTPLPNKPPDLINVPDLGGVGDIAKAGAVIAVCVAGMFALSRFQR